jgi:two-component system chemotaxis response regulator CheB
VEYEIIVIGTSWGGLAALRDLVTALPAHFGIPVVMVQHRHPQSGHLLASLIQDRTSLCVCEVEDKTPIAPGTVYVAPADYHLLIERGTFALSMEEPVRFSRPSIDVTLESAADAYGSGAVGVMLTGANADGARGLRRIADRHGLTIVQRPDTAESPAMPAAALSAVPEARVLTLPEIGELLANLNDRAARTPISK